MTKEFIKNYLKEYWGSSEMFKRNLVKEYLQILVLSFLYSLKKYQNLVFYGGSCLRFCFGLNRLSEDLDFIDLKKKVNLKELKKDLVDFFKKETDLRLEIKIQKFRLYLKFPILEELGLAQKGGSNLLFLKIEIFKQFDFCSNFKIQIIPVFKFNKSVLIRTFDLSTLMATKLRAALFRKWEKTDKKGKVLARVKGRDYYDLMWYFQKEIKPNLKCLEVKTEKKLKEILLKIIKKLDQRSIRLDLEALIEDKNFVKDLSKNLKNILIEKLR